MKRDIYALQQKNVCLRRQVQCFDEMCNEISDAIVKYFLVPPTAAEKKQVIKKWSNRLIYAVGRCWMQTMTLLLQKTT